MAEGIATTQDAICRGEIVVDQPKRGYRFNVDSVILADFAVRTCCPAPVQAVDLGAGCGIVGLLLARRWRETHVRLVEIQPELAELAAGNIKKNGLFDRVVLKHGDLRDHRLWSGERRGRRVVVSNPPFHKVGTGRLSPTSQVAVARHEISCTLEQLVSAAARGLVVGEALVIIHEAERLEEIGQVLHRFGFGGLLVRMVRPLPERGCSRVLVRATRGGAARSDELDPLVVHETPGVFSPEMARILKDKAD